MINMIAISQNSNSTKNYILRNDYVAKNAGDLGKNLRSASQKQEYYN